MAHATITGNIGQIKNLEISKGGTPYLKFSIAWSERQRDGAGQWFDGPLVWVQCTAFGRVAEGIAADLRKGVRVTATGTLKPELWASNQGESTVMTMAVDSLGVDLTWQAVQVSKREAGSGQAGQAAPAAQQQSDPWGGAPAATPSAEQEPPF